MRKLYKEGKECMVDPDQLQLMEKAGWSTSPAKVVSEPEVKEAVEAVKEEPDESDAPKKVRSRKIKKIEPKE